MRIKSGRQADFDELDKLTRTAAEKRTRQAQLALNLDTCVSAVFDIMKSKGLYSSFKAHKNFALPGETDPNLAIQHFLFELSDSLEAGFPGKLFVFVQTRNDGNSFCKISSIAILPASNIVFDSKHPAKFIAQLFQERAKSIPKIRPKINQMVQVPMTPNAKIKTKTVFEGVVEIDELWKRLLLIKFVELIEAALKAGQERISQEIENRKNIVKSGKGIPSPRTTTIIVNGLDA